MHGECSIKYFFGFFFRCHVLVCNIEPVTYILILATLTLSQFNVKPAASVEADGATILVPDDYQTIQDAI